VPHNVELAECDNCGTGVCVALAWEGAEPILVFACDCYGLRVTEALEPDVTPPRWK